MIKFKNNQFINSLNVDIERCKEMLSLKSKYNLSGIEFKALINILVEMPQKPDNLCDCEEIYFEIIIRKFQNKETTKWTLDKLYEIATNQFKINNNDNIYDFIIESYCEFKEIFKQNELNYNNGDFYCFMYKIFTGYTESDKECAYPFLYTFLNNGVLN